MLSNPHALEGIDTASPQPDRFKLWNVPRLPARFVPRGEVEEIVQSIAARYGSGNRPLEQSARLGIHGMGGIGKTILAAAVARRPETREALRGGVFWLTLGQKPNLSYLQQQLAQALGASQTSFADTNEGKQVLTELVRAKHILLVLDDVWDVEHALCFDIVAESGLPPHHGAQPRSPGPARSRGTSP